MKIIDFTPQEDLRLATEDIRGAVAAGMDSFHFFSGKLSELLPGIVRAFQNTDKTSSYENLAPLKDDQRAFTELVNKHSYLELREIKGYIPQGFQATYLQGLEVLMDATTRCTRIQGQVVQPFLEFLAPLVSHKEAFQRPGDQAAFFTRLGEERTELYKRQKALYASRTDTRAKIGQLAERNADWTTVLQLLNRIVAELESIKRDELDMRIKHAEDYLVIIEGRLKGQELPDVSPEVTQALAEGAYQIACELEFFSMTYYWVLAMQTAIRDSMLEIARVVK